MTTTSSLYDSLGGAEAIGAVVEDFYDKVMDDPGLAPWFEGLDMGRQKEVFAAFLRRVLRDGDSARGGALRRAHAGLVARGLSGEHFDAVVGHLADTLAEHGASVEAIKEVGGWAESIRGEVLGR